MLPKLLSNSRFYILAFAVLFSIALFSYVLVTAGWGQLAIIKLTRYYAFCAISFLYVALLIGPAVRVFPFIVQKGRLIHARRGIGVSAFYFVVLHSSLAFFGQLGGFPGLFYLDNKYLLAISFSFTAEVILSLMAATSFDFMIKKLTYRWWKFLHRFVYLAAFLVIVHALLIGSDFQDRSSPIFIVAFALLVFLLVVEALAWDKYLALTRPNLPRHVISYAGIGAIAVLFLVFVLPNFVHLHYVQNDGLVLHSDQWDWVLSAEHAVHYIGVSVVVVFFVIGLIITISRKEKK